MQGDHPHFSEFSDENQPLEGEKKEINQVLNKEILVTDFRVARSKYYERSYLTIQFKNGGNAYVLFTGSEVLANQVERYKDKIPFYTTIIKRGKYFKLS